MGATSRVNNVTGAKDAVLIGGACSLSGLIFTPTSGGNSVIVYDSITSGAGTILCKVVTSAVNTTFVKLPNIEAKVGVWVVQTGVTSETQIYSN